MALYDRILGDVEPKIPVHAFQALLAEFGRGQITGAQAQSAIFTLTGESLDQDGVTEAQALLATVTAQSGTVNRLARVKLIDDVLLLAESRVTGYSTPALIKTRLGV